MKEFDAGFIPNELNILLCENKKINNIDTLKHFYVIENFCYNKKFF